MMNLTWLDATSVMLLFVLGSVIVQALGRGRVEEPEEKPQVTCHRHDWVRSDSRGLVCQSCGKLPG